MMTFALSFLPRLVYKTHLCRWAKGEELAFRFENLHFCFGSLPLSFPFSFSFSFSFVR